MTFPGVLKKIEHIKVFWWTTCWSMWVHLWLWLVYKVISPETIAVWEAWVTLGMFPLFIWTTWLVDTRGYNWFAPNRYNTIVPAVEDDIEGIKVCYAIRLCDIGMLNLCPSPNSNSAQGESSEVQIYKDETQKQYRSILYYRSLAVQKMAGLPGTHTRPSNILAPSPSVMERQSECEFPILDSRCALSILFFATTAKKEFTVEDMEKMGKDIQKVFMKSSEYSVLESVGEARVQVVRMHGDLNTTLRVSYTCKDDTAVAGLDYEMTEGTLVFGPGQESAEIVVKIVDDDMSESFCHVTAAILFWISLDSATSHLVSFSFAGEPDVTFAVVLTVASIDGGDDVKLLRRSTVVTIVDDDDGGVLVFELPTFEAGTQDDYAEATVIRRNGTDGKVQIDYDTKDGSAIAGQCVVFACCPSSSMEKRGICVVAPLLLKPAISIVGTHYKQTRGTLVFESGQTRNTIRVPMVSFNDESHLTAGMLAFKVRVLFHYVSCLNSQSFFPPTCLHVSAYSEQSCRRCHPWVKVREPRCACARTQESRARERQEEQGR